MRKKTIDVDFLYIRIVRQSPQKPPYGMRYAKKKKSGTSAPQPREGHSAAHKNDDYCASFASKTSPHSGQNFGRLCGSSGVQPHLLQRNTGFASGFFAPQLAQNLP